METILACLIWAAMLPLRLELPVPVPIVMKIPGEIITPPKPTARFPLEENPLRIKMAPQPPDRIHRASLTRKVLLWIVTVLTPRVALVIGQLLRDMVPQSLTHIHWALLIKLIRVSIVMVLVPRVILAMAPVPVRRHDVTKLDPQFQQELEHEQELWDPVVLEAPNMDTNHGSTHTINMAIVMKATHVRLGSPARKVLISLLDLTLQTRQTVLTHV